MTSRALLHIIDHDVLSEGFMDSELTGTERYALSRAYNKLSQNNLMLTGFEAQLVGKAAERFREYYTPKEQEQIQRDLECIEQVQRSHLVRR